MLEGYNFFLAVFTDGDLSLQELKKECLPQNWAPILALKTETGIAIPVFRDPDICLKFIKRNAPPKQMVGIMGMSEVDKQKFLNKGWELLWHEFPKLYKKRPGFEICVEVIETDFDLHVAKK